MQKLLVTAAFAMVAATAPLPAQAAPDYDYRGGCSFATPGDVVTTSGPHVRNGVVFVDVRAVNADDNDTDLVPPTPAPTTPISVTCELLVDGVSQGTVLSASGTGVAANAGHVEFVAARTSIVDLCDNVTVGGEFIRYCAGIADPPLIPQPVQDLIDLVAGVVDGLVQTEVPA